MHVPNLCLRHCKNWNKNSNLSYLALHFSAIIIYILTYTYRHTWGLHPENKKKKTSLFYIHQIINFCTSACAIVVFVLQTDHNHFFVHNVSVTLQWIWLMWSGTQLAINSEFLIQSAENLWPFLGFYALFICRILCKGDVYYALSRSRSIS